MEIVQLFMLCGEYVEHFHENVTLYITDLLENADAFIPDAKETS
jgi:hypothetical protein